jgi:hypothetical protein
MGEPQVTTRRRRLSTAAAAIIAAVITGGATIVATHHQRVDLSANVAEIRERLERKTSEAETLAQAHREMTATVKTLREQVYLLRSKPCVEGEPRVTDGARPIIPGANQTKQVKLTCGDGYQWLPDFAYYQIIVPADGCWTTWQRTPRNFWWGNAETDGDLDEEYLIGQQAIPTRHQCSALGNQPILGHAFRFRNTGSRPVTINVWPRYQ